MVAAVGWVEPVNHLPSVRHPVIVSVDWWSTRPESGHQIRRQIRVPRTGPPFDLTHGLFREAVARESPGLREHRCIGCGRDLGRHGDVARVRGGEVEGGAYAIGAAVSPQGAPVMLGPDVVDGPVHAGGWIVHITIRDEIAGRRAG